ncbi:MAG: filamentous hemagglutinin N-terminal domain-containing protein [Rhizonema sp. PD38]|nr:filamentous hemagglutinin N-terminal domain-containing protein [Rhizonema sp. PD38]
MSTMAAIWRQLFGIVFGSAYVLGASCATAQITPDRTLPNNSSITINGSVFNITGGTQAGRNLFHSFQQFSVPTGGTASFNNGLDIQNIISRVTGGSVSNIDGIIRASGTANLFLLNPSGIIFGRGAALSIGGSFLGTTALSLKFADGTEFGVSTLQQTPLLTVSVPIGLQYNGTVAPLQVASQAQDDNGQVVGLQVKSGKTLALVGGEVQLNGGSLQAANGRIELGGVTGSGTVGLQLNGDNFSLSYPVDLPLANVSIQNASQVDVTSKGAGSIVIKAFNLDISGNSKVFAGIAPGLTADAPAGDITLNATGNLKIAQSQVANIANSGTSGNTGNINVSGNIVQLTGGGQLRTRTLGNGDAGNINIQAGEIFITNPAYSFAYPFAEDDQPALDASNYINDDYINAGHQTGRSGNISLQANGSITLIGEGEDIENKVISTYNAYGGKGGGNILLKANDFISLSNANLVSSSFSLEGGAANVLLDGKEFVSLTNNSAINAVSFGIGNSGNITIKSLGSVTLQASRLNANIGSTDPTFPAAQGNAGNINLSGRSVSIKDGSLVTAVSTNSGKPGNIVVNAQELVELSGIGPFPPPDNSRIDGNIYSSLTTSSGEMAQGPAGNININIPVGTLRLSDSASIRSDTQSSFSGGIVNINALVLELTGGGQIFTTTNSSGNAGNINLNITDRTNISGSNPSFITTPDQAISSISPSSGVFANTLESSTGKGGNITLNISRLIVDDGAQISTNSLGQGDAGNLNITARSLKLDHGSITTTSSSGTGGNIDNLQVRDLLLLRNHSQISTSSGTNQNGDGNGGNITINAKDGFIVAVPNENSDITANAFSGSGGKVQINATGIFGLTVFNREDLVRIFGSDLTNIDFQRLPSSITAISQTNPNLNGQVNLYTPDVDPSRGLVTLPTVTEVAPTLVSSICDAFNKTADSNSFTITGHGGLPPNPDEPLTSDVVWSDTRLPVTTKQHQHRTHAAKPKPQPTAIIPATGWVFNDKGEVTLISSVTNATTVNTPTSCPVK